MSLIILSAVVGVYLLWFIHHTMIALLEEDQRSYRFRIFSTVLISMVISILAARLAWIVSHWGDISGLPWSFVPYDRTGSLIIWGANLPWVYFRFDLGVDWLVALWSASAAWVVLYWLPLLSKIVLPKKTILPDRNIRLATVLLALTMVFWLGLKVVTVPIEQADIVWLGSLVVGLIIQWRWSIMSGWYVMMLTAIGWQVWLRSWWSVAFAAVVVVVIISLQLAQRRRVQIHAL